MERKCKTKQRQGRILSRVGALFLAGMMLTGTCGCKDELSMEDWEGIEEDAQDSFASFDSFVYQADCIGTTYRTNHLEQVMTYLDLLQDAVDTEKFVVQLDEGYDPYFVIQAWMALLWTDPRCSELQLMKLEDNQMGLFYGDTNSEAYSHTNLYLGYMPTGTAAEEFIPEGPAAGEAVPAGFLSEEDALQMQRDVEAHVEAVIQENIDANYTEAEKAQAIYLYLVKNFELVNPLKEIDSIAAMEQIGLREAVMNEYGSAMHFALVYNFYLAQLGMDSVMVMDYGVEDILAASGEHDYLSEYLDVIHCYNGVYIDGKWYLMDIAYEMAEYNYNLQNGGEAEPSMSYFGMSWETREETRLGGNKRVEGPTFAGRIMEVPECPEDLFMGKEE